MIIMISFMKPIHWIKSKSKIKSSYLIRSCHSLTIYNMVSWQLPPKH